MKDLIDRQAVLDIFKPWLEVKDYSEGELNMLRAVIYELETMPNTSAWVSVKDKLPDDEELYLICTESNFGKINIAYYQPIGDKFSNYEPFWQGKSNRSTRVTHWMPLPEPPESGDDTE